MVKSTAQAPLFDGPMGTSLRWKGNTSGSSNSLSANRTGASTPLKGYCQPEMKFTGPCPRGFRGSYALNASKMSASLCCSALAIFIPAPLICSAIRAKNSGSAEHDRTMVRGAAFPEKCRLLRCPEHGRDIQAGISLPKRDGERRSS